MLASSDRHGQNIWGKERRRDWLCLGGFSGFETVSGADSTLALCADVSDDGCERAMLACVAGGGCFSVIALVFETVAAADFTLTFCANFPDDGCERAVLACFVGRGSLSVTALVGAGEISVDVCGTNPCRCRSGPGFAGGKPLSVWADSSILMAFVGPLTCYH